MNKVTYLEEKVEIQQRLIGSLYAYLRGYLEKRDYDELTSIFIENYDRSRELENKYNGKA